ncbi:MAG: hypothetical protein V2I26_03815 [Halieaceae bacterium]|nr:hypothetical protein [Halieaceae bacterium]
MTPWTGMEALVTRSDPQGQYPGTLWKEQVLSLAEALELFTLNSNCSSRPGHCKRASRHARGFSSL